MQERSRPLKQRWLPLPGWGTSKGLSRESSQLPGIGLLPAWSVPAMLRTRERPEAHFVPLPLCPRGSVQNRTQSRLTGEQRLPAQNTPGPGCSRTPWWPAANYAVPPNCQTKSLRECHLRGPNTFSSKAPEGWAPGSHGRWDPRHSMFRRGAHPGQHRSNLLCQEITK